MIRQIVHALARAATLALLTSVTTVPVVNAGILRGMIAFLLLGALFSTTVSAGPVQLQEGTATFSQGAFGGGPYNPSMAIDGIFFGPSPGVSNGWTIARNDTGFEYALAETAVWETQSDVGAGAITFKMYFLDPNPGHLLGRFRFSVTEDDRSTFADGLAVGGDVTANWTVLTNAIVVGPSGMTFTTLSDDSVLASGTIPGTGIYEVTYQADVSGITGIRLEALEDPSLPGGNGPGFFQRNGNFVLTELEVSAACFPFPGGGSTGGCFPGPGPFPLPEPPTLALLALGLVGLGFSRRPKGWTVRSIANSSSW